MTFFAGIRYADSQQLDAFGRLRVSSPHNTFEAQFNYNLLPLLFEESNTGTGAVSHVANSSAARLTTGGTGSGAEAILQTFRYFRYQPGKSNLVVFTCIFGVKKANVRKRVGLFDVDNGFFFEQDGSNFKVVRRTKTSGSVVDNVVNQSSWNLDVLDGSGGSGVTLAESFDNIFVIDFQWLGAGRIRYGFDFDGQVTYVHEIKFANTEAVPFTVSGDLPFHVEITNTAAAASSTDFDFTCVAIASEGGFDPLGVPVSAGNDITLRTVSSTPLPILSIRPRTTFNSITSRGQVIPLTYQIFSEDAPIAYQIVLNGSLTGASFANVDTTNSIAMVDVAATAISGGVIVDRGYVSGTRDKNSGGRAQETLLSKLALGLDLAGTTADILSIVCTKRSGGTDSDCGASMTWKEVY